MAMIVERSMSDGWLTNTYLVAAGPNSDAFLVDAGAAKAFITLCGSASAIASSITTRPWPMPKYRKAAS